MKIALLGYGKMGHMVEEAARRADLETVCVIDPFAGSRGELKAADVCIDFSEPSAVIDNVRTASEARVSMVVGTTGWYDRIDEVRGIVQESGIGFVYSSNFSVGVNVMFRLVERAAEMFSHFSFFDPFIQEAHHKFKKDAPSGTAIFLQRIVEDAYKHEAPVSSTRAGHIPGTHTVGFDSEADTLTITHTARNRTGFAEGAIIAAQWIATRKGFYDFSQVIDELFQI